MHTRCGPMTMVKCQRVAKVQTLPVEPPLVNMASNLAPKSKKQTPEWTPNIYKIQNDGWPNSEKETYLWRTHSIIGIS